MGNFDKAELLHRKALDIVLRLEGRGVTYATSLANIASLCMRNKKYEEANGLLEEALEIYDSTVGKDHPLYATA